MALCQIVYLDAPSPLKNMQLSESWQYSKFSRQIVKYESWFYFFCTFENSKIFIKIETENSECHLMGSPDTLTSDLFSPTPTTLVTLCLRQGVTLLFSTQHPENCLPWGTLLWPDLQLSCRELVLGVSFLPSTFPPTIHSLETSPPSTQVHSGQHPCPAAGILPVLRPILLRNWCLKDDFY